MSHNYRQARRNGWLDGDGYHISLETILAERGLVKEKRLRDNDSVRASLAEMKKEKILCEWKPYDEKLTLGRRPRLPQDCCRRLHPLSVSRIRRGDHPRQRTDGRDEAARARRARGRFRRSGPVGVHEPGEIRAALPRGRFLAPWRPGEISAALARSGEIRAALARGK